MGGERREAAFFVTRSWWGDSPEAVERVNDAARPGRFSHKRP